MSDAIITASQLGKKYRIRHQASPGQYTALRDVLADKVKGLFRGRVSGTGPTVEDFWALRDVSFEVRRGDVVGVIGRNGAGKSTLLKILSRITEPSEGRICLRGRVASLLEVGTGFHPELTGRENIFLNGAILGMSRREIKAKFDAIVDFSGVERHLDTPVKRYSSGMYVRLAFAVAAHLEPEILIVDEVLAVGDAEFQKKCLGKMQNVASNGRTVLFVSHNMGAIAALCGTGLLLDKGRVSLFGAIDDCIQQYINSGTAGKLPQLEDCRVRELKNEHRPVEFVDIRFQDGETHLEYGSRLKFLLAISSDEGVTDVSIGGSLFDAAGTCVGTFFTDHCVSVPAKKTAEILLELNLPELAPGHYTAGFSLGRGSEAVKRTDYDVVIGMPAFEILAVGDAGNVSEWPSTWGRLCLNGRIKLTIAA